MIGQPMSSAQIESLARTFVARVAPRDQADLLDALQRFTIAVYLASAADER